ncbi:MAG: integral rane sensor signal transduction histidine kinase [Caulobacter sp.]|nr:integral rane sensor signal transduction histidine kinase [Caulobacter sp.]
MTQPGGTDPGGEAIGPVKATKPRRHFGATSLFGQVMGLVIVSLIAAQVVTLTTLFVILRPPPQDVYHMSDLVKAFQTGQPVKGEGASRPLVLSWANHPPPEGRPGWRRTEFRDTVAKRLDVDVSRVVISVDGIRVIRSPPPPEGRDKRGLRPLPPPRMDREDPLIFAPIRVAVRQDDGRWLIAHPANTLRLDSWLSRALLGLFLSMLVIAPLAWLFARRLAAPIGAFAGAAERLGRDPNAPPLELKGSSEVNAAVAAFNGMQDRLRRYVEHRTAMVGAIAHDLRTPLTRLRFRIEGVPDDQRGKLAHEVEQMDAMISATLSFVRDANFTGDRKPLELSSLVESVIDESAETGADAAIDRTERVVVHGDPIALKRLVENLVENALKYGGEARGRVFLEDGLAVIEIEDKGPGVPPHDLDRVFEPFYRGEPSRSRSTGGIGLGLAVARSIARGHGGDVSLVNGGRGGLTARVVLPAAP